MNTDQIIVERTNNHQTVTLKEWNAASTQQRDQWLITGTLIRLEDIFELERQAFPWKHF